MKKVILSVLCLSGVLLADGVALYKTCKKCHGAKGEKVALGKSKVIASMSEADIIATMKGYKDGTYGGPMKAVMIPQVKNLSDADIKALAQYIQTIK